MPDAAFEMLPVVSKQAEPAPPAKREQIRQLADTLGTLANTKALRILGPIIVAAGAVWGCTPGPPTQIGRPPIVEAKPTDVNGPALKLGPERPATDSANPAKKSVGYTSQGGEVALKAKVKSGSELSGIANIINAEATTDSTYSYWILPSGIPFLTIHDNISGKTTEGAFLAIVGKTVSFDQKGTIIYFDTENSTVFVAGNQQASKSPQLSTQNTEATNPGAAVAEYRWTSSYLPEWFSPTIDVWGPEIQKISSLPFFNKDPRVLAMFITIESFGDPNVQSRAVPPAQGLSQFMPATWEEIRGEIQLAIQREQKNPPDKRPYSAAIADLGIDLAKCDRTDPVASIFFMNQYLRDLLPQGPIPTSPKDAENYIQSVKTAGWHYNAGKYATTVSPESAMYMRELEEMMRAVITGDKNPQIAQGFAKYYIDNPAGYKKLKQAVDDIKRYKYLDLETVKKYLDGSRLQTP